MFLTYKVIFSYLFKHSRNNIFSNLQIKKDDWRSVLSFSLDFLWNFFLRLVFSITRKDELSIIHILVPFWYSFTLFTHRLTVAFSARISKLKLLKEVIDWALLTPKLNKLQRPLKAATKTTQKRNKFSRQHQKELHTLI